MIEENVLISYLKKFDQYPFKVKINQKEYVIGSGEPQFTVILHKSIPLSNLMTSTSLALGEAYMDGNLEIEGDLYFALDHFLGQMGKFTTDESALKKIMHTSTAKKNQQKEVQSHYDIGNDFYKLWLDETMSYSCGYFIHLCPGSAPSQTGGDCGKKRESSAADVGRGRFGAEKEIF